MFCELGFAKSALGPADGFEFRIGRPAVKHVQCHGLARSRACLSDKFEERSGDQAGAVCEIRRSIWFVAQHRKDIAGLE